MNKVIDLVEAGPPFQRNARACVIVDEASEAERKLSFYDYLHERFIGENGLSGEPWFFRATKSAFPDGRVGYVIGPEVTRFLRLDAQFRVASPDGPLGDVRCKVRTFASAVTSSTVDFEPPESSLCPEPTPPPPRPLKPLGEQSLKVVERSPKPLPEPPLKDVEQTPEVPPEGNIKQERQKTSAPSPEMLVVILAVFVILFFFLILMA